MLKNPIALLPSVLQALGVGPDVEPSLSILDGLHARWTVLLRAMRAEDFDRKRLLVRWTP